MKKKNITLLALVIILVVLFSANKIITSIIADNEAKKEAESESESEAARIFVCNLEDIANITFNNGTTDLSFSYTEDGGWVYDSDADCPLDQDLMTTFSTTLLEMESNRELTGIDSLDSYGLDEPSSSVTITDAEGNKQTYYIGDTVTDEYSYLMTDADDSIVYTVEPTWQNYLAYNINSFVKTVDVTSIWSSKDTSITVDNGEDTVELTKNGDTYNVSKNGEDPYEVTNTSASSSFISAVSIAPTGCVNYKPSEEQLDNYGVNTPQYTITVKYTDDNGDEQQLVLYIGNESTDSTYVIYYTSESDMVMYAENSCLDSLAEIFNLEYVASEDETTTAE